MIQYLLDSSALWRIMREAKLRTAWLEVVSAGAVGSCHPQRTEFRRSARNLDEYEQMNAMFGELYPDVALPRSIWQWVESAQYRLLRAGVHRATSTVDLLISGTAAHHGLVVLHDDKDYVAASRHLSDLRERGIHNTPSTAP